MYIVGLYLKLSCLLKIIGNSNINVKQRFFEKAEGFILNNQAFKVSNNI
jgi:hypothetical protein